MIAVNGKDWDTDIEIGVFVVYGRKTTHIDEQWKSEESVYIRETVRFSFVRVAQQFDLDRFITHGVFSKQRDCTVKAVSRRFIFVKEVASQENEVDLTNDLSADEEPYIG